MKRLVSQSVEIQMIAKPNIVFSGGLGNQLYQLCFLWYLQKLGFEARPDFSEFSYYAFHQGLELNKVLNTEFRNDIDSVERSRRQWYRLFNEKLGFWLRFHYNQWKNSHLRTFIREQEGRLYGKADIPQGKNITLKGHWQMPEYVESVKNRLYDSVSYVSLSTERDHRTMEQIKSCTSVSIHIRRGDYLKETQYQVIKDFGYYDRAIQHIKQQQPEAHFFVFSDDMAWVKSHLCEPNATFVDWNTGKDSFKDMLLMSLCKHNIIANSTFSWWGAYLNQNPQKTVICPDKWLVGVPTEGRVPTDWVRISV